MDWPVKRMVNNFVTLQAKLTESTAHNFLTVSVFFVLFCFSLFLGIMMLVSEEMTTASKRTTYNAILLSLIGFGRLFVKAKHAESIRTEVISYGFPRVLKFTWIWVQCFLGKKPSKLSSNPRPRPRWFDDLYIEVRYYIKSFRIQFPSHIYLGWL